MTEEVTESIEEKESIEKSPQTTTDLFDSEGFLSKLIELVTCREEEAKQVLSAMMEEVWARPPTSGSSSESFPLDSGTVSKTSSLAGGKRIAGTQRIAMATSIKRGGNDGEVKGAGPSSSLSSLSVPPLPKKQKKMVPVIDDSINDSTEQPCKECAGVSVAGNMVLLCNGCSEAYHMRCVQPPITPDDASSPTFVFLCHICINPRSSSMNSSRSSSPKVRRADVEKRKIDNKAVQDSLEELKRKKALKGIK